MRTIVLVSHDPSEKTMQFIRNLPGEVTVYQYGLHADHKEINQTVITTLRGIHKAVNLSGFGRVVFTPPGMSAAVPLMVAGLLGITGAHPEILNLWRNSDTGLWEPVPGAEIVNSGVVYGVMRKERNKGQITQSGVLAVSHG
jgi:hypothetical protein